MNRLMIFAHYNRHNDLADYVIYILKKLQPYYSKIILVSNSFLGAVNYNKLSEYCSIVKQRENKGYSFGAWKEAIIEEGWNSIVKYDTLTLMNDSCIGPLFDVSDIFQKMQKEGVDFWGISCKNSYSGGLLNTKSVQLEYIRPHFISFNSKITNSNEFQNFWKTVKSENTSVSTDHRYKAELTSHLCRSGYTYNVYTESGKNKDLIPDKPVMEIKSGLSFIKIKSILEFPDIIFLLNMINRSSDYPVKLLIDYIYQNYPSKIPQICGRKLIENKSGYNAENLKTAVHIHCFFIDVMHVYINFLNKVNANYDLYITVPTKEISDEVNAVLASVNLSANKVEIIETKNIGRDLYPWLSLSDTLSKYDVVGHFHTKKSPHKYDFKGESWLYDNLDSLIGNYESIMSAFESDSSLGIVIPDVPYYFQFISRYHVFNKKNRKMCTNLWNRMSEKNEMKNINFDEIRTPLMSYGTMFWYRPQALKPLFDLSLKRDDFSPEPLPIDGTIAHAIERLPVYIAWSKGYDFKICNNANRVISGFEYKDFSTFLLLRYKGFFGVFSERLGKIMKTIKCKVL